MARGTITKEVKILPKDMVVRPDGLYLKVKITQTETMPGILMRLIYMLADAGWKIVAIGGMLLAIAMLMKGGG